MDDQTLIWDHLGLAEKVCTRMRIDSSLVCELTLETLEQCVKGYDPSKGEFRSYARVCLKRAYIKWRDSQPYHEAMHENVLGQSEAEELKVIDWREELSAVRSRLTEKEFSLVWRHFVEGVGIRRLSHDAGQDRRTIWNQIRKIKKKCCLPE